MQGFENKSGSVLRKKKSRSQAPSEGTDAKDNPRTYEIPGNKTAGAVLLKSSDTDL